MVVASRAVAVAGGQEFFAGWLRAAHAHNSSAPPEPERWTNYTPKFFSPAEFSMLQSFTEILIPTDDTPGAREAHVAHYIDFVVSAAAEYAPEIQKEWKAAVVWLADKNFGAMTSGERTAFVGQLAESLPAYRLIKQMTVFAFYTSRAGLVDDLGYQGIAYLTEFPACDHPEHRRV
jgi:gluconate 2-dehydrogenase subunit 3-like protein